jgi:hypothetical protein
VALKREPGVNPGLTRSGIGERRRHGFLTQALFQASRGHDFAEWEAVVVGGVIEMINCTVHLSPKTCQRCTSVFAIQDLEVT